MPNLLLLLLQQYRISSDTAQYLSQYKYLTTLNADLQFFVLTGQLSSQQS